MGLVPHQDRQILSLCKNHVKQTQLIAVLISLLFVASTWAEDWPQWRGPTRDGVWTEQGVLKTFAPSGLKIRWRTAVGLGLSSPIVAQGRVFLTDVQLTRPMTKERVLCFEAESGKPLWTYSYDAEYPEEGPGSSLRVRFPRPFVTTERSIRSGRLTCFAWTPRAGSSFGRRLSTRSTRHRSSWTYASPLIEGNLLIIFAGRFSGDRDGLCDCHRQRFREDRVACRDGLCGDEFPDRRQRGRQATAHCLVSAGRDVPRRGDGRRLLARGHATRESEFGGLHTGRAREHAADRRLDDETRLGKAGRRRALAGVEIAGPSQSQQHLDTDSSGRLRVFRPDVGTFGLPGGGHRQGTVANRQSNGPRQRSQHPSDDERGQDVSLHRPRGADSRATEWQGYQEIGRATLLEPTSPYEGRKFAWAPPAYANRCIFARSDKELVCASLAE